MATPKKPQDVRLVVGVLYSSGEVYRRSLEKMIAHFGEVQTKSNEIDFEHTSYYKKEMGDGLKRHVLVFKKLVCRDELAKIKNITNEIESELSLDKGRQINLDPGIISLENFVLASCKGFSHRIYLKDGVYGDLTLIFKGKSYVVLDWTYPDYAEVETITFLNEQRALYKKELELIGQL
jgi:hypothetical protein